MCVGGEACRYAIGWKSDKGQKSSADVSRRYLISDQLARFLRAQMFSDAFFTVHGLFLDCLAKCIGEVLVCYEDSKADQEGL